MWLALVQSKEAHRVPDRLLHQVLVDLCKRKRVQAPADITPKRVRDSLRHLQSRKRSDYMAQIAARVSSDVEEWLKKTFQIRTTACTRGEADTDGSSPQDVESFDAEAGHSDELAEVQTAEVCNAAEATEGAGEQAEAQELLAEAVEMERRAEAQAAEAAEIQRRAEAQAAEAEAARRRAEAQAAEAEEARLRAEAQAQAEADDREARLRVEAQLERQRAQEARQRVEAAQNSQEILERGCVICMDGPSTCVVTPCGHMCVCAHCKEQLSVGAPCPICRTPLLSVIYVFVT
jgi:hypothetical protein